MSDVAENGFATLPTLAPRPANAHKGDFGRVLIVAGSRGMSGAAVLAGSSALRSGAGLVTVAVPQSVWPIVAAANPAFMTLPLPDESGRLSLEALRPMADAAHRADVVVVGPGLGRSDTLGGLMQQFIAICPNMMVIDADALNALGPMPDVLRDHRHMRVITPHPGEFCRLSGKTSIEVKHNRAALASEFANEFGIVVVLKGHGTLVTDGTRSYRNPTGNPGMATAGSGDVLAGLIGALAGQGLDAFAAAQLGVYLHGMAGDLARDEFGEISVIATDLIDHLPRAFVRHTTEGRK